MAQLSRHASLRFSVFDVAFDAGIESQQLDGNFTPILEGDESEEVASPSKQRQTHSSDELTDSPYPLTPPESATGIGRGLLGKKAEDHPRFIERFATPTPENIFSASNPSTPKPAKPVLGKLRKAQTSPLEIDLTQDSDREPRRRDTKANREDGKQSAKARSKSKDASREKHQFPTTSPADEDEKKGLSGLLRFRTKSKERKAAAKQANQVITEEQMPPPRPHTPPPLPIAGRFARQAEEVAFRPTVRESGSSHAGTSSIGHVSNSSVGDSSETHESYPKARNRSSRYERPHPAWRTVPSGLGVGKLRKNSPVEEEKIELPDEVHAYPPGQTIFDREPVRPSTGSEPPKEPEQPQVDMDAINAYYGFTEEPVSTQPSTPLPQARVALFEALSPVESKRPDPLDMGRATPVPQPSAPVSPSPFIVPSPNPAQSEFGSQARNKRGGVNFTVPPPINSGLTPPRRMTNAYNPPPTPPPTTELPPIPTQPPHVSPSPGLQVTIPDQQSYLSPYPPSAHRSPSPLTPLGSRSSSPNLRSVSPSQPSPLIGQRPGTAPQQAGPSPSLPPVQRGKVSPFPTRPITPTNRPITPTHRPITPTHRPITPTVQTVVAPASPAAGYSPISGNNYLLTRRPDFDSSNVSRPKGNSSDNIFVRPNRPPQQLRFTESTIFHTRPSTEEDHYLVDPASPPAPRRNRSIRKSKYRSGYDSDDAESRYSRDTYYGRETAYFDDSNIPDIPSMRGSSEAPPMPRRNFSDQEDERKMGRERLLRMLETQNQTRDRPRYF